MSDFIHVWPLTAWGSFADDQQYEYGEDLGVTAVALYDYQAGEDPNIYSCSYFSMVFIKYLNHTSSRKHEVPPLTLLIAMATCLCPKFRMQKQNVQKVKMTEMKTS